MKEIIERVDKKGWEPAGVKRTEYFIGGTKVSFAEYYTETAKVNDLLADESFVKAVFGEEPRAIDGRCTGCDYCEIDCNIITKPNYIVHCSKLSTIFSPTGKIKYIKENWI